MKRTDIMKYSPDIFDLFPPVNSGGLIEALMIVAYNLEA